MTRTYCLLLLAFLCSCCSVSAQLVKGSVFDDLNESPVKNAAVVVLDKDSMLISFTRSSYDGSFQLSVAPGRYVILVSHPAYIELADSLRVQADSTRDLGQIRMTSRSIALKEFVIKQHIASIKFKGDTLEYVADSFRVAPNATVEDLLKVLPGVQVNKNGEITTQGQQVQKVYVDGEEFFGDDPTMATQNLKADAVEKVQVFDEKSEQASFTGFDDGETTKAINIKLKEGKNKGVFGKATAGAGPDNRYNGQLMANRFTGKQKISAYGTTSNTRNTGLNWQDNDRFAGDDDNTEYNADEGTTYRYFSDDDDNGDFGGVFYGQGIPQVTNTGGQYSNKWNDNLNKVNTNYRFRQQSTKAENRTNTKFFLPDSFYYNYESQKVKTDRLSHRLRGRFDYAFDTTASVTIKLNGGLNQDKSNSFYTSDNLSADSILVSQSQRDYNTRKDRNALHTEFLLKKKLKKKSRTFSLSGSYDYNLSNGDAWMNSTNHFYSDSSFSQNIDQYKNSHELKNAFQGKVIYTEPLGSRFIVELSYRLRSNNSELERNTYERSIPGGDYNSRIDSLSNNFVFNSLIQTGGISVKYNYKKTIFTLGGSASYAGFFQDNLVLKQQTRYSQVNYFPFANFIYRISQFSQLRVSYSGYTSQPTIQQVQPLRDNTDPLNVYLGNPGLQQEYNNSFSVNLNNYKALAGRGFYISSWVQNTLNSITLSQQVDGLGRRVNQYVNLDGNYSVHLYSNYFIRLNKLKSNLGFGLRGSRNQSVNLVLGRRSVTTDDDFGLTFDWRYYVEKKWEVTLSGNLEHHMGQNNLQQSRITYLSTSPDLNVKIYLPRDITLASTVEYIFRPNVPPFNTNFTRTLWDASISKKLLKSKNLELRLYVYDILKQNRGYNRSVEEAYAKEQFYNTLTRYYLVSVTWNFNKGATPPND